MNHILGEFKRSCPNNVTLFGLHRQGVGPKGGQVDLHGSDFAIGVTKGRFRKIAVFQTKRIIAGRVSLEFSQLDDAMKSGLPTQSLFVLAADPSSYDFRICAVETIHANWPSNQGSQRQNPSSWATLRPWTKDWLECRIGALNDAEFQSAQTSLTGQVVADNRRWWPSAFMKIALPNDDIVLS